MSAALAAAHITHQIEHSSALMGFLVGAAVGLGIAVLAAATVLTGGAALAVVAAVGGIVAATGAGALAGMALGGLAKSPRGAIAAGSENVTYGPARMLAARVDRDIVACQDHGPKLIATGSDSVFVNGHPAVRHDDKTECDGTIKSDLTHIGIGAETVQYLPIESEVPEWMVSLAQGMVIVGGAVALVFGVAAAAVAGGLCAVANFAGTAIMGFAGGVAGTYVGGEIGFALGGEDGRVVGQILGGFLGGLGGARLGNRMSTGHPVDVATGELFTTEVDFTLPGIIPITWERFWISSSTQNETLGHKWHHPYDLKIAEGTDFTVLRLAHGRLIMLPVLHDGDSFYHRAEKLTAIRENDESYVILTQDKEKITFRKSHLDASLYLLDTFGDLNGNDLQFAYDSSELLTSIQNCAGTYVNFSYDANDRIQSISKKNQNITVKLVDYQYDAGGNLSAARNGTGVPFSYDYDNFLITRETRRSGLSFYFEWDDIALGRAARCVKTWGDNNLYFRQISYNTDDRKTDVIDSFGHKTTYIANNIGLVILTITPLGFEHKQSYNVYAELEAAEDGAGYQSKSAYDDFGRLISFTDANGAVTKYTYHSKNPTDPNFFSIRSDTNPLGRESQFVFDGSGNLASVIDPLGNRTGFLRDGRGLPLAVRDDEGTLNRFVWSASGDLVQESTANGGQLSYTYDAFGQIVTERQERDGATHFTYDDMGQLTEVQHADGGKTRLTYDVDGNLVQFTDQVGRTTGWHFGQFPFPVSRTNPDGSVFGYRYDTELNLVGLQNESRETYQLIYDADGNLVEEIGFDGRTQSFAYNGAGHVTKSTDGHRVHAFVRDPIGRLLSRQSSDGDTATYAYDAAGQMMQADNAVRKLAFAYDPRGLLIEEKQDDLTLTHAYSARGQRINTLLPDGRHVKFGYDNDGMFASLGFMGRDVMQVGRDRLGRETQRQAGQIVQRTDYDPQGRIQAQRAVKQGQENPIFGRSYQYDPSGLINEIKDMARGTKRYQYNAREQLRAVTGDQAEIFAFDPAGNILGDIANPNDASVKGGRLLMQGDNHFTYDDAGNRTRLARGWGGLHAFDYAYDDQNQLIKVTEISAGREKTTRFTYDALGRRVRKHFREVKKTPQAANAVPSPDEDNDPQLIKEETTWFLWNGDVLLAEGFGDASGAVDPLGLVYIYEPDSFRPAAQIRRYAPEEQGQIYLYWLDHLGTPQEITNEAGELVWQVALKAWGGIDRVLAEQVENNLRFQGQYHDTETGLHYNRFRHYDPGVGCFVNQDPIGLLGGEVSARYAHDPHLWIDPLGLELVDVWHFTDKAGYNAITSGKDIVLRASPAKGTGANFAPKGNVVSVSRSSPEALGRGIAKTLHIGNSKTQYAIRFQTDSSNLYSKGNNQHISYIKNDVRLKSGTWSAGEIVKDGKGRRFSFLKGCRF